MSQPLRPGARPAAALIAAVAWVGLLIQASVVYGWNGSAAETALWLSRFFTIIGNGAVAIGFSGIALGSIRCAAPRVVAGLLLSVALIGLVYNLLLVGLIHRTGWHLGATVLLHDVVPLLVPLYWLVFTRKGMLGRRDPWIWAVLPTVYLLYALARGLAEERYPYPFLNLARIGWEGVLANAAAIGALFVIGGYLLVWLDGLLARRVQR